MHLRAYVAHVILQFVPKVQAINKYALVHSIHSLQSHLEVIQGHTFWHRQITCDFIYRQSIVTSAALCSISEILRVL